MTPRALQALDFIRDEIGRFGLAPTYVEIARHLGMADTSKGRIAEIIDSLVDAGKLVRHPKRARGLALPAAPDLQLVDTEVLKAELARRGVTMASLARPRPIARDVVVTCAHDGCGEVVERGKLYCLTHWRMLPPRMQQRLIGAFRSRDTFAYQAAFSDTKIHLERVGR
ncbi:LexA family protein [Sphingomonas sp. CJ99]